MYIKAPFTIIKTAAVELDFKSKLFAERAIEKMEKKGRKNRAERNFLFACPKVCFKAWPGNRERVSFRLNIPHGSFWYISDWQSSHGTDFYSGRFYAN